MRISDWSSDVCSSDLVRLHQVFGGDAEFVGLLDQAVLLQGGGEDGTRLVGECGGFVVERSEEHTSELQSLMRISYAVFCLKKKKKHKITTEDTIKIETDMKTSQKNIANQSKRS